MDNNTQRKKEINDLQNHGNDYLGALTTFICTNNPDDRVTDLNNILDVVTDNFSKSCESLEKSYKIIHTQYTQLEEAKEVIDHLNLKFETLKKIHEHLPELVSFEQSKNIKNKNKINSDSDIRNIKIQDLINKCNKLTHDIDNYNGVYNL